MDDGDRVEGLQLDLLTIVARLEQAYRDYRRGRDVFAGHLFEQRIMGCDVQRLRCYLTAETRRFAYQVDGQLRREVAEAELSGWAAAYNNRNAILRSAADHGVPQDRIVAVTGISRTTVGSILRRARLCGCG